MEKIILTIDEESEGIRIDKLLASNIDGFSRTAIQKLIDGGSVCVSGKLVKASFCPSYGQEVQVSVPDPQELKIEAENIPIDILYEDNDILIVNKPKDMVVHPSAGHYSGTLVNAIMYHCGSSLSGINGILRPGIVHRIDKDTTGALVICKNDRAHISLCEQLKVHSITRRYEAIATGHFKETEGRVEAPIGRDEKDRKKMAINLRNGKEAITNYKVLKELNNDLSYIQCVLETGRTHQIRVHMASLGHPLLGDEVYGKPVSTLQGQCLHARILGFIHPSTNEYVEFEAPLPSYFTKLLNKYEKKYNI